MPTNNAEFQHCQSLAVDQSLRSRCRSALEIIEIQNFQGLGRPQFVRRLVSAKHSARLGAKPAAWRGSLRSDWPATRIVAKFGDLVRSFKQVAVDQTIEERRIFDLAEYIEQILTSLRPRLKKSSLKVVVECADGLMIDSYPGAFYQIISNFVLNFLIHGFDGLDQGTMRITAEVKGTTTLALSYRDDGRGMQETTRRQIFDPFFTTQRGAGGTGLGMHIVFNLVTELLGGSITCSSEPDQGVAFQLLLPNLVVDQASAQETTG